MKIEFISNSPNWLKGNLGDAISATANANGFTVLGAIASGFNWDRDIISSAAEECNKSGQVVIVNQLTPTLLLVPKTRSNTSVSEITKDLIAAANALGLKKLNFTHYVLVLNRLPKNEITEVLTYLLNPNLVTTLETIYWDIDSRYENELKHIYNRLIGNEKRLML